MLAASARRGSGLTGRVAGKTAETLFSPAADAEPILREIYRRQAEDMARRAMRGRVSQGLFGGMGAAGGRLFGPPT